VNTSEWGGWDSNPGPADYESSTPAICPIQCDLGGRDLTRSCLVRFGHVFGMIMLDAGQPGLSRPDADAPQPCVSRQRLIALSIRGTSSHRVIQTSS
jgi:hypothetical protein